MTSTTGRRLALPALALAGALALTACGGGQDVAGSTTSSSSSGEHGSGHSTEGGEATGNDDVRFLTGMTPHHEQAIEMSDIVLQADPPAEVAALAKEIKSAQAPEIEQMDQMLEALGHDATGGHGGGHSDGHGGMMSDAEMAALRTATGTEAARLYLEKMIEHHQGAIDAADEQIAQGSYAPAVALAKEIKTAQAAEITTMQAMLRNL